VFIDDRAEEQVFMVMAGVGFDAASFSPGWC